MKRILAALGVTSLALFGATATAFATDESSDGGEKITICHATGSETNPYVQISVDFHAVEGHSQHSDDIIPGNRKWDGRNWDDEGQATYYNGCVPCPEPPVDTPEEPPVVTPEEPPVVTPEEPPVVTPEEPPVVTPVVPPVVTPIGAVVAPPAAPAAVVKNPGFNVQTAVAPSGTVLAPWVAGLIVMLLAAAGVAVRKVLPAGGVSRDRKA
jgi:hypothetical protein